MMQNAPRIDVIVPVYNGENFLSRSVESLLAQTFQDFVVTLVDDGSADGSAALCEQYAARDSRVRLLRQENAGPSAARNRAVERSEAAYIAFVDADDRVSENYLFALYTAAEHFGVPMAVSRLCREYPQPDGGMRRQLAPAIDRTSLERDRALAEACYERLFGCFACGRLVKREVAAAWPFPEGRIFEDSFAIWRQFMACDRVAYVPEAVYYYLQRPESLQHRSFEPHHLDLLDAAVDMIDMFQQEKMPPAVLAAGAYKVCRAAYVTAYHAAADLPYDAYRPVYDRARALLAQYRPALDPSALSARDHAAFRLMSSAPRVFYTAVRMKGK